LSKRILAGEIQSGDTVEIEAGHEGQLIFRPVAPADAVA
jgi:hypothetical protein